MKTADELSDEMGWTAKPADTVKREPLRMATGEAPPIPNPVLTGDE